MLRRSVAGADWCGSGGAVSYLGLQALGVGPADDTAARTLKRAGQPKIRGANPGDVRRGAADREADPPDLEDAHAARGHSVAHGHLEGSEPRVPLQAIYSDPEIEKHMALHHPEMMDTWAQLKPIEKADTFRYPFPPLSPPLPSPFILL